MCKFLYWMLSRILFSMLEFFGSCVTWVTLLYSDSRVTWHLNLYLNLYYVRILLCHVRGSVQGNVQCRMPRKINKKTNILQWSKVVMTQGTLYDCICIQIQNCNWHQLKVTVSSEVSSLWILFKLHPVDIKTRIEKRC